jgi:peptidyl-prolyl cis-trans isomerase B (cyclophilin B)
VAGKDRDRALARAKLERQMAKRYAQARRRRQIQAGVGAALAVALVAVGTVFLVIQLTKDDNSPDTAAASQSSAPSCTYTPQGTATKDVGVPPADPTVTQGTERATMTTNQGVIEIDLAAGAAPCTVNSFSYLASKKYFDNTPCHRVTSGNLSVLQCGDPGGTGAGGPGYQFPNENLPTNVTPAYPAGTVAMANSGADTNGSQFFLVYKDSTLPADYSVFGTITKGLDVVTKIAAGGVQAGGQSATDGKPKLPVTITSVTVAAPATGDSPAASAPASPATSASAGASPTG